MKRTTSTGALTLALALAASLTASAQQQEPIPDAPRPRVNLPTIPTVGTVRSTEPTPDAAAPQNGASQGPAAPAGPAEETVETPAAGQGVESTLNLFRIRGQGTNLVVLPFTVKDKKGNLIAGLTYKDVHIYENDVLQHLNRFITDSFALSVAMIIDQSMAFTEMDKVNAALPTVKGAFADSDEISVFTYNNGPKKWTDFTGAQSARLEMTLQVAKTPGREGLFANTSGPLSQNINKNSGADIFTDPNENSSHGRSMSNVQNMPKEPHTLNDAIYAAAKELTRVGKGRRRVIYIISNGNEYGSKMKQGDVIKYLQAHEITVYATQVHDLPNLHIPFTGFVDRLHLPLQMRNDILPLYANATGGLIDPELTTHGITTSLNHIAEAARTQYTAVYSSSEPFIDGKFRKIDVRVLRPDLDVVAKPGYYPTTDRAPATDAPTPPPPPAQ